MDSKKGQKVGSRGSLSKAVIVEAAVDLADCIGVDALTIRKLADALSVKPMTIYYYLTNKDAIIDGMVDYVFGEIDLPPTELHWKQAMRQRCASARVVLATHPWAVPLLESRRTPGPATLRHHDHVIGCLRKGGLNMEFTAHAYALIDAFVYGFAIQEASLPATSGADMHELAEQIVQALPEDEYPNLIAFTREHVLQPNYDFGTEFDFGLNLILDGLEKVST